MPLESYSQRPFPPPSSLCQNWFHGNKIEVIDFWHPRMKSFVEPIPVKGRKATLYCGTTNGIGCILIRKEDVCHLEKRGQHFKRPSGACVVLVSLLKGTLQAFETVSWELHPFHDTCFCGHLASKWELLGEQHRQKLRSGMASSEL